ncbi:MAG: hypothetical protein JXB46_00090 [Candidatus Eisenbacteria bacterium]|nr:hypothetical protein [Candidatus Eisenbacteria bacterium]
MLAPGERVSQSSRPFAHTGCWRDIESAGCLSAATDGYTIELTNLTFTGDGDKDIIVPSRPITIRSQVGRYGQGCDSPVEEMS